MGSSQHKSPRLVVKANSMSARIYSNSKHFVFFDLVPVFLGLKMDNYNIYCVRLSIEMFF